MAEAQGCFQHLGYVDHHSEMLLSAYAACDVFVLPSTLETPGLADLEAAALGAKIVVTQEGCTREYFGDAVTYVDPLSVDSITAGIHQQLEASAPLGLSAKIADAFTWKKAAHQLIQTYTQVLKSANLS